MKNIFTLSLLFIVTNSFAQSAGSLDNTFGNAGKVLTSISNGQDKAYGAVIQSDKKIVAAGYSSSTITGKDFACVRYKENGALDSTFGIYGKVSTDIGFGSDDVAYSIALQTDGKFILAGFSDNGTKKEAAMIRYKQDGSIDSTFGTYGIVLTVFDTTKINEIRVVKVHTLSGKIIVGGTSNISSLLSKPVVARYLSDGRLDTTFNKNGIRLLWVTKFDYQYLYSVEDLTVQSNGKISAIGWRDFPAQHWASDDWACRINIDGTMDNAFSDDGVNIYSYAQSSQHRSFGMCMKADGGFFLTGGSHCYGVQLTYDFTLFDVNNNGTANKWYFSTDFGPTLYDLAYGIVEDNNGKFVLGGSSGNTTNTTFALCRINGDTAILDNSFGTGGQVTTKFGSNSFNECFDVLVQPDNKIVAAGFSGNDFAIARYLGQDLPQLENFQLLSPPDLSTNLNYQIQTFDWSDAYGAKSYEVVLDTTQTFIANPQTYSSISSTLSLNKLSPNKKYYWKVRATEGSNWGAYSNSWSFTTNSLENFSLITPTNNSIKQETLNLTCDWSDAVGTSSYEFEIDSSQTFSNSPQRSTIVSSTIKITKLNPSTNYFWHVRALNESSPGIWSITWTFKTKSDSSSLINNIDPKYPIIYPNPLSDILYIRATDAFINCNYVIIDFLGKEVLRGSIDDQVMSISLGEFNSGIYYLQIGELSKRYFTIFRE